MKEAESRALEYLYTNADHSNRIFHHRILYQAETGIEPAIKVVAMELGTNAFIVFTLTPQVVDEASFGGRRGEFVALFDERDRAIKAVFDLTQK
jgi:hypothetical protein